MKKSNIKQTKCLNCKIEFSSDLKTKPFCSKRCSYVDLNNWLDEKYAIETNEDDFEKDN